MRRSVLVAIARGTRTSLLWLATGEGPTLAPHDPDAQGSELGAELPMALGEPAEPPSSTRLRHHIVPVQRANVTASAGGGSLVEHEQIVDYLGFSEDYMTKFLRRRPQDLLVIEARGDSMEPKIRSGDLLTLDIRADQGIENGELYVIRVSDTLLVKRLELLINGGMVLHSENSRYTPQIIARDDVEQVRVLGRVLLVTAPPR